MHHIHVNDDDRSRPSPGLDFQVHGDSVCLPELGGEACLLFDLPSARALVPSTPKVYSAPLTAHPSASFPPVQAQRLPRSPL